LCSILTDGAFSSQVWKLIPPRPETEYQSPKLFPARRRDIAVDL